MLNAFCIVFKSTKHRQITLFEGHWVRSLASFRASSTMASSKHPFLDSSFSKNLHNLAYTNCNTRIIDLKSLELPEEAMEADYRQTYLKYITSRPRTTASRDLESAVQSLTTGIAPPVAFPTETVYGLGADATNGPAISGIFSAKGRPSDNPLIVHVASKEHLERLTGEPIPKIYEDLVESYWPGPLTILIPVPSTKSVFAKNVHPGQRTIGFRVPSSKYARFLISACNKPIAAPSANSSGKPSPTTAQHVLSDLNGKINFILDGGSCNVGVESTVVDGLSDPPVILRPGGVSRRDLVEFGRRTGSAWERVGIGYEEYKHGENAASHENGHTNGSINKRYQPDEHDKKEAPRAPGMKYKHYAPQGKLILFEQPSEVNSVREKLVQMVQERILPNEQMNGHASAHDSPNKTSLVIVILTTSKWPDFARLDQTIGSKASSTQTNGEITVSEPSDDRRTALKSSTIPLRSTTVTMRSDPSSSTTVKIYTLCLGRTPTPIAHSLFSALRTCDDLDANYIFAEAPLHVEGHEGRDWEVVMERMGKAASQVIRSHSS